MKEATITDVSEINKYVLLTLSDNISHPNALIGESGTSYLIYSSIPKYGLYEIYANHVNVNIDCQVGKKMSAKITDRFE